MGQMGSVTWSNTSPNRGLQCRMVSGITLKEDHWGGAESGTKEFIRFMAATPICIEFGPGSSCLYVEGSPPIS